MKRESLVNIFCILVKFVCHSEEQSDEESQKRLKFKGYMRFFAALRMTKRTTAPVF